MLVLADQGIEDQFADELGLGITGHAGIEIGWAVLDDYDDGV